jgi:hypothetical protein
MRTAGSKQATIERREKVWQLRVVERKTYRQIARELGITVFTAHQDAKFLTEHRIKALEGKDKELIVNQNEIYEALLNKWVPVALDNTREVDDQLYATDRVTKILSDQAKLFGFHTLPRAERGQAEALGKGIAEGVIEAMANLANRSKGKVIEAEVVEQPRIPDAQTS